MNRNMLSQSDVEKLLADPSPEGRLSIVEKVGHQFTERNLTVGERALAESIFRVLVADAEVRVREALSAALSDCPDLPHDVALSLAKDVGSVALPVIMNSIVLGDDDLIQIIESGDSEKQVGVARRPEVSAVVSSSLAAVGNEAAVAAMIANPGADIPEQSFHCVLDRFSGRNSVQDAVAARSKLPVSVSEKLVSIVGERLYDRLLGEAAISDKVATDVIMRMRARVVMALSSESDDAQLNDLIGGLMRHGRLTPALVVRAACMGDIRFFEAGLAARAGVPMENAVVLIHDQGGRGLEAICGRAGIPEPAWPALKAAVEVARETDYDGGENDRERFTRRMVERVLTQWGDLGVFLEDGDVEYLLGKMESLGAAAAQN